MTLKLVTVVDSVESFITLSAAITSFLCAAGLGASLFPVRSGTLTNLDQRTQEVFQKICKDAGVRKDFEVRLSPIENFEHSALTTLNAGSNLSSAPILYLYQGTFTDKIGMVSYNDVTFFTQWQASLIGENARCVVFLAGLVTTVAAAFFIHVLAASLLGLGVLLLTTALYEGKADEFAIRNSTLEERLLADRACRALVKEGHSDLVELTNKLVSANISEYLEQEKVFQLPKIQVVAGMTRAQLDQIVESVPAAAKEAAQRAATKYCAAVGIETLHILDEA